MARGNPDLRDPWSGRRLRIVPAPPGAPSWRRSLWRRLERCDDPVERRARGPAVVVPLAPGERAALRAWLAWRGAWARAQAGGPPRDRWLGAALSLARIEPALGRLIPASRPPRVRPRQPSTFASLGRAIAHQQLSGRAAETIWGRVRALFRGAEPEAGALLGLRAQRLRGAGLSAAKVAALRDLAAHVVRGDLDPPGLARLPDPEVLLRLTRVRGIGPWSAQMHLMFALARPDVWPTGDLGVRKGVGLWKGLVEPPTPRALEALGEPYRPCRSVAAWYAWRALEIGWEAEDARSQLRGAVDDGRRAPPLR